MRNKRGFTLAELLIVVAIIAVLVGVSIPVFTSQLEKSREAKDLANVRSAYAEMIADVLDKRENSSYYSSTDGLYVKEVPLGQKQNDWQSSSDLNIAGIDLGDEEHWIGSPEANGVCKIKYKEATHETYFIWSGDAQIDNSPNLIFNANTFPLVDFKMNDGDIYTYNGEQYVCHENYDPWVIDITETLKGTPDNFEGIFIKVNQESKILTSSDIDSSTNNLGRVETGTVYQDGSDYYIMFFSTNNAKAPTEPGALNWVKINY